MPVIHGNAAPGTNKAVSAGQAVAALNPEVEYIPYQCDYCHRTKQSTCGVVNSRPRIRSEKHGSLLICECSALFH